MVILLRNIILKGNGEAKMNILYETEEFDVSVILTLKSPKTPNFGQRNLLIEKSSNFPKHPLTKEKFRFYLLAYDKIIGLKFLRMMTESFVEISFNFSDYGNF